MFEDKLQLPEEPGLFRAPITKSAKNRRVYSEARKSLAVLPSTRSLPRSGDSSEDLGQEHASTRWKHASTAILKGIRSTNTVESTAGLLKYFSVTKELNKEQLLHEKFCHLVAIDGLEGRTGARYKEANALAAKFREIKSSLNPGEQLEAMDAAQSILNKLEQVRQLFEIKGLDADEAEEMFEDIDDSLDDLRELCQAKTLKSKFRQAGQQLIIAKRLAKAGQEQTRKRLVREAFQRSVRKAQNVRTLFRPRKDSVASGEKPVKRASSPTSDFFQKLQASQEDFKKRSAEWKQSLAEEVMALGQQMPTSHRSGHVVQAPPNTPGGNDVNAQATSSPCKASAAPFVFSAAVDQRRNSLSERKRRDSQVAITSFDFLSQDQHLDRGVLAEKRKKVQAKIQYMQWLCDSSGSQEPGTPQGFHGVSALSGNTRAGQTGDWRSPKAGSISAPTMYELPPLPQYPHGSPKGAAPGLLSPRPPPGSQQGLHSPNGLNTAPRSPNTPRLASQFFRKNTGELHGRHPQPVLPSASPSGGSQRTGMSFMRARIPWSAFRLGNPLAKLSPTVQTKDGTGTFGGASDFGDGAAGGPDVEHGGGGCWGDPYPVEAAVRSAGGGSNRAENAKATPSSSEESSPRSRAPKLSNDINASPELSRSPLHHATATTRTVPQTKRPPEDAPAAAKQSQLHAFQPTPSGNPGDSRTANARSFTATAGQATARPPNNHFSGQSAPKTEKGQETSAAGRAKADPPRAPSPLSDVGDFENASGDHDLVSNQWDSYEKYLASSSVIPKDLSSQGRSAAQGRSRQLPTPKTTPTAASSRPKIGDEAFVHDSMPSPRPVSTGTPKEGKQTHTKAAMVMAELETLVVEQKSSQASFAASAFLATVGLDVPLDPTDSPKPIPPKVQTYSGLLEAKTSVVHFVARAEEAIEDLEDPQEALQKLMKLDRALGFLEHVGILESCLQGPPVELELPSRGSDYDWNEHVGSLRRVKSTLSSSDKWQPLETSGSNPSFQETSQISTSRTLHPERLEWIQESHASLRACRSQHAEFAPQRKTLETTLKERHQRGVRLACVRPELSHMWQEYCRLVWKEDSGQQLSFSASRSVLLPGLC
ncbi:unnamed protein product [Symbiodinium sp. CCMP2592]|nr:unnamed protein product [Symbiodinium sp. CCMP2592]